MAPQITTIKPKELRSRKIVVTAKSIKRKVDCWQLAIGDDKCQSNLRNKNPKTPENPQMDVLIDCERKTVAATYKAM
jgi:hypothetical protein